MSWAKAAREKILILQLKLEAIDEAEFKSWAKAARKN